MVKAHVGLLAAALLLGAAAPTPVQYRLIGVGTNSCGKWTSDRSGRDFASQTAEEQWVLGFLSGMGFLGGQSIEPLNGTDADGVWAWIDNYCHANPLDHISKAAAQFSYFHPR